MIWSSNPVFICKDITDGIDYVYKFFSSDSESYLREKTLNELLKKDDCRSAKSIPVPELEEKFILRILRTVNGSCQTHEFDTCLRWKYHPLEDMMQMLICLASKLKCEKFDAPSMQWVWSRIVKAHFDLLKEDRIHHNDMKFDNVILELG
jgi:hypothetical protein